GIERRQPPVRLLDGLLALLDDQARSGRQGADAGKEGARAGHVLRGEIRRQLPLVERARTAGMLEQRFDLGGEREVASAARVVEGLHAGAVAGQDQAAPADIEDGDREHAVQILEDALAFLLVEMSDDLAVAVALEGMAARHQAVGELAIVVDLAVEDHPYRAVFVRDRLVSAVEIDDREPAEAEDDVARLLEALLVRPARALDIAHALDERARGLFPRRARGEAPAAQSAHGSGPPAHRHDSGSGWNFCSTNLNLPRAVSGS